MLVSLKDANESISVENVDDIAVHDGVDTDKIITTVQAKHSLISSGTTFGDTSESLWRTLEIWLQKLENGTFDSETKFVCSTNKVIPDDSLLRKMKSGTFENTIKEINVILTDLESKEKQKKDEAKPSPHISVIIKKIKSALLKPNHLKLVFSNLIIEDGENVQPKFLEGLRLTTTGITEARKVEVYENFYGWLIMTCFAKWKNSADAVITKQMFDSKWAIINSSPQIVSAIFRKKEALGTLTAEKRDKIKDELFVRQINDIERGPGKKMVLEKAITDFIHHEIEMSHVIDKGDFTSDDFETFRKKCGSRWEELFYEHVTQLGYSEEELNSLAIKIYDATMNENQLNFQGGFEFDLDNRYIKNGSFLKLSNKPEIGWRPDWAVKYKIDD